MNVLIFSHTTIDENVSEGVRYISWGGPGMFMSKVFSQLPGVQTAIVSNYGKDYLKFLEGKNIYPSFPALDHTLVYQNLTKGNFRTQKALLRENSLPVVIDSGLKLKIKSADIIIIAPILPNYSAGYVSEIFVSARKHALKIILPQGYFRNFDQDDRVVPRIFSEAQEILPKFDFVIVSEQDSLEIEQLTRNWAENFGTKVIITRGDKGASLFIKDKEIFVPTNPVPPKEIVNSVGVGDTFSAGFAYEYLQTKDAMESIKFAHKLAAIKLRFTTENFVFDYSKLCQQK
jgi:hypothetical protein